MTTDELHKLAVKVNWAVAIFFAILVIISFLVTSCSPTLTHEQRNNNFVITMDNVVTITEETVTFDVAVYGNGIKGKQRVIAPKDSSTIVGVYTLFPKENASLVGMIRLASN